MVINEELQKICNEVIEKYGDSLYTHNIMQYKIKEWANKNNYICDLEYEVKQRDENSKRRGKIDIRIVIDEKVYLIEIDSSNKKKSIYKLLNNEADYRIWIRASNHRMEEYINNHREELKDILIIPVKNWR